MVARPDSEMLATGPETTDHCTCDALPIHVPSSSVAVTLNCVASPSLTLGGFAATERLVTSYNWPAYPCLATCAPAELTPTKPPMLPVFAYAALPEAPP